MKKELKKIKHLRIFLKISLIVFFICAVFCLVNYDVFRRPFFVFSGSWQNPAAAYPAKEGGLYVWEKDTNTVVYLDKNGVSRKRPNMPAPGAEDAGADGADIPFIHGAVSRARKNADDSLYSTRGGEIYHARGGEVRLLAAFKPGGTEGGIIPGQVAWAEDGAALFYDRASGHIYELTEDGLLREAVPAAYFDNMRERGVLPSGGSFSAAFGAIAGVYGNVPWLYADGRFSAFPKGAAFSPGKTALTLAAYGSLLAALFALAFFLYLYIVHLKRGFVSLYITHTLLVIPFSAIVFFLLYGVMYKPPENRLREQTRLRLISACAAAAPFFPVELAAGIYTNGIYHDDVYKLLSANLNRIIPGSRAASNTPYRASLYTLLPDTFSDKRYILWHIASSDEGRGGIYPERFLSEKDAAVLQSGGAVYAAVTSGGARWFCADMPLVDRSGAVAAVLEIAEDARGITEKERHERNIVFESLLIGGLILTLIMMLALFDTTVTIRKVIRAMKALKSGGYKTRLDEAGGGETGRLCRYFNHIAASLEAKQNAEAASLAERSFTAMLSHEIRTPLNAIIGLSEIEIQNTKLNAETKLNIQKIYSSGRGILEIVNDILDVSKIEAGSFDIVDVEYATPALISDAAEINKVRIKDKPIQFKIEVDPALPLSLYGDDTRLKQVLNNLLSNAFKYTQKGSVSLRVSWEKKKIRINELFGIESNAEIELNTEGILCFVVEDTGIGIKEEDQGKIFEKYGQADLKKNKNIEGTGLGLAITRQLITLMRGTIELTSVYGKGSCFTVRVPQRISGETRVGKETAQKLAAFTYIAGSPPQSGVTRAPMPGVKVLVVDDVETNRDVAKGLLKPYQITVDCAQNGAEAVEFAQKSCADDSLEYDVIFIDHLMSPLDGVETAKIIRSLNDSEYIKKVPIIVMTGNARDEYTDLINESVFTGYLAKPIDIASLDAILRRYIQKEVVNTPPAPPLPAPDTEAYSPAAIPPPAGIEAEKGAAYFGSFETYLEMLSSFIKSARSALVVLEDIHKNGEEGKDLDLNLFTIHIHGIKGAAFGIFARELGERAGTLEQKSKGGDRAFILRHAGNFIAQTRLLLEDLEAYINAQLTEKPTREDIPARLLEKLKRACGEFDISAIDEVADELKQYEYTNDKEFVSWLLEKIEHSGFDEIIQRLPAA